MSKFHNGIDFRVSQKDHALETKNPRPKDSKGKHQDKNNQGLQFEFSYSN